MPDVRFICVSDTHLGAENSILTRLTSDGRVNTAEASETLLRFVACLKELIASNEGSEKPVLVLNGDILELALASTSAAALTFQRFIEALLPPGQPACVSRIIYIPGNHDHHVWQAARETAFCEQLQRMPAGGLPPQIPHTTALFSQASMRSALLDVAVQQVRQGSGPQVEVMYPNCGFTSRDGRRCVVFHHGHFLESIYSVMSRLQGAFFPGRPAPTTVSELEADNGAWIDFFWSSLGNSGDVGPDVELLYEKLQDRREVRQLVANLANAMAGADRGWFNGFEAAILTRVLEPLAGCVMELSRNQTTQPMSPQEEGGLRHYLEVPLRNQLLSELGGNVPDSMTFVFGHTHRPFEGRLRIGGFPAAVRCFNTGGWVVDSPAPQPLNGAGVVLLDDQLDAVSLRLLTDLERPEGEPVRAVELAPSAAPSAFQQRIAQLLQTHPEPWRAFSAAAGDTVRRLRAALAENIHRDP